jgi:hypothetical protein
MKEQILSEKLESAFVGGPICRMIEGKHDAERFIEEVMKPILP